MSENTIIEYQKPVEFRDALSELIRAKARELIVQAVEVELQELLSSYNDRGSSDDRAAVVRSGYQPRREIQTGVGPVTVRIPKVRSTRGEPVTFRSALVPPYVRKARSLSAAAG